MHLRELDNIRLFYVSINRAWQWAFKCCNPETITLFLSLVDWPLILKVSKLKILSSLEKSNDFPSEVKFTDPTQLRVLLLPLILWEHQGPQFYQIVVGSTCCDILCRKNDNELHCSICQSSFKFILGLATHSIIKYRSNHHIIQNIIWIYV